MPRSPATRDRIERFLSELGRLYFIPLPSGWEDRSPFVGRYGNLDVFTFDPVSTCLSKIARGTGPDVEDVLALLGAGLVQREQLVAAFHEIVPRLPRESVRVDEADFRRKFDALIALLDARRPTDSSQ